VPMNFIDGVTAVALDDDTCSSASWRRTGAA
jgi:hypothetical protein